MIGCESANPFPETGARFTAMRGKAQASRRETRRVAAESGSRCRSRSSGKGRGGLLPGGGRQSGFPLGNARAKWRRSLERDARCETIEPCRFDITRSRNSPRAIPIAIFILIREKRGFSDESRCNNSREHRESINGQSI